MTGIIVLCRYSSSRLPGKILKPINGKPILKYILERLSLLNGKAPIVICTSDEPTDDRIVQYCIENGIKHFRGSLNNVAERFLSCAQHFGFSEAVRINGDNIFLDYELIEGMITQHVLNKSVFTSNVRNRTYPKGMSVEIVSIEHYAQSLPLFNEEDKEHVMTYFYRQNNLNHFFVYNKKDYGETLNFAIDTSEDFYNATQVIRLMERDHTNYKMDDIIELYRLVYEKK